jgi:hypothetical protein
MQFADLAFGLRKKADVGMQQPLVNGGNIFLIATDAIERQLRHSQTCRSLPH